jgi:hypothetical protein
VGNNFAVIKQRIERVATTANREVTLSFWAKGVNPAGGFIGTRIAQNFGTGGSPSAEVSVTVNEDFALTASWQRFTVTFTPPSVSGKTLGTGGDDYLEILIGQITDTSTDAWNMDISNVQLELGDTATAFEYVTPADQLARCQRYFYTLDVDKTAAFLPYAYGFAVSATRGEMALYLPVQMRAIPVLTIATPTAFSLSDGAAGTNATTIAARKASRSLIDLTVDVASGLTQFRPYRLELAVGGSGSIEASAEL